MQRTLYAWPVLTLAAAAAAGPLQPERLPADASWVVHADLELATSTKLGRLALREIESEVAGTAVGQLDIRAGKDVKDITLFGWDSQEPTGIFLATMTDSADRLFERVVERADYERLERDGLVIHSWIEHADGSVREEPGEPDNLEGHVEAKVAAGQDGVHVRLHHHGGSGVRLYAVRLPGADANRRVVLATDSVDALLKTMRVIDDKEPSRADPVPDAENTPVPVDNPPDAFLFIAATDPASFGAHQSHARIAKMADVLTLSVGERDEQAFINLTLNARTKEDAAQIASVLQGLVALAQLSADPQDEETAWLRDLARSVTFTADDVIVTAACRFDPDILIKAHEEHTGRPGDDGGTGDGGEGSQEEPSEPEEEPSP